jgi:flagellar biosynthesis protein FlhG
MNTAVSSRLPHPASRVAGRNVITVASGKGGVGKTWFAITVAHALAQAGRRVLLFDGDLGLANVDIQLGLMPEHDLDSVLAERVEIDEAVTRYEDGGFDILAGRSGSATLAALPPAHLTGLRDRVLEFAQGYDAAIMDLSAGIEQPVRILSAAAAVRLVVTTDEPTALTDAYAFIKLAVQRAPTDSMRVVVNMAQSESEGRHTYATLAKACQNFLRMTPALAGIVRRDNHVRDAIRSQTALLTRHPNCHAAADVHAIARGLGDLLV